MAEPLQTRISMCIRGLGFRVHNQPVVNKLVGVILLIANLALCDIVESAY